MTPQERVKAFARAVDDLSRRMGVNVVLDIEVQRDKDGVRAVPVLRLQAVEPADIPADIPAADAPEKPLSETNKAGG